MVLGIAGSLLALGLLLLVLAVMRERRLLHATRPEAAEAVAYIESRVQVLNGRLEELGRLDDIAEVFGESDPSRRSDRRRRGRKRKRRSRS